MLTGGLLDLLDRIRGKTAGAATFDRKKHSMEAVGDDVDTLVAVHAAEAVLKIASDSDTDNITYANVVNISDKGRLKCIYANLKSDNHDPISGSIEITIDGGTAQTATFLANQISTDSSANNIYHGTVSISLDVPFSTSLLVRHKKANTYGKIVTTVVYTTD
ncbi:MAG TPA: hypothetical protein PKK36_09955 [Kiritimatiellia bacterium]|nr:hypothetical protein [Kiritimatiellia bacterium]